MRSSTSSLEAMARIGTSARAGRARISRHRSARLREPGHFPQEGALTAVRRYELMLVLRPDAPEDRTAAIIDRVTRQITADGGQIIKVAPWGRRRLAYAIDRHREGSYHIILFEAPPEARASATSSSDMFARSTPSRM